MVGDSPYDAEAAGKVGLKTIGLLCGGFAEAELRKAGAAQIFPGSRPTSSPIMIAPLSPNPRRNQRAFDDSKIAKAETAAPRRNRRWSG